MEGRLAQLQSVNQKDKAVGYTSLLREALEQQGVSSADVVAHDVRTVIDALLTQDHVAIVVGRQVLTEFVGILKSDRENAVVKNQELKKRILEDTLALTAPKDVTFAEQANNMRLQLAKLLEDEEDWNGAARVLSSMQFDNMSDNEKLKIYVHIVRLLLEEEEEVQAETYYKRAAVLVDPTTTDRETQLQVKLCQARIHDFTRKFLEAASRYHELSWAGEIDEGERTMMLLAAVTCAVLSPAGPNRSRVLAALCRDERTHQLPSYNILSKIFLDRILRPSEVKEFEATLRPHQLATIAQSSNDRLAAASSSAVDARNAATDSEATEPTSTRTGPSTVLDRAVLEHNLLAASKVYNNISFAGLGALLDLTPGAAETMARRMIEQGRLKASIDQVERLIWFEDVREESDAQGRAGGLGEVDMRVEDTGAPFTKKWDAQIRMVAANVEEIVQHLADRNLVSFATT